MPLGMTQQAASRCCREGMHRSVQKPAERRIPPSQSPAGDLPMFGGQITVCDAVRVSQGLILPTVVRRVSLRAVNHMQENTQIKEPAWGLAWDKSANLRLERENNHGEPRTTSHSDLRPKPACSDRCAGVRDRVYTCRRPNSGGADLRCTSRLHWRSDGNSPTTGLTIDPATTYMSRRKRETSNGGIVFKLPRRGSG